MCLKRIDLRMRAIQIVESETIELVSKNLLDTPNARNGSGVMHSRR